MLFNRTKIYLKTLLAIIFIALSLSACSFTPIYSNTSANAKLNISYDKPTSRLEQIVYQELKLRLGAGDNIDSNFLVVKISQSTRNVGRSSDGLPTNIMEVKLTGNIFLYQTSDKQNIIFKATRVATASYRTSPQSLNNQQALASASEQAALELAQIIRLTLLGELNKTDN